MSVLTKEQISHMADRFCGWPIPENWQPDGGVSYERFGNKGTEREFRRATSGTNLFSKQQAEEMISYMLEGITPSPSLKLVVEALEKYAGSYRTIIVTADHNLEFYEIRDAEKFAKEALNKIREMEK